MFLKSAINFRANILSKFPNYDGNQYQFCFAYGSAVKQQLGYDAVNKQQSSSSSNMIDIIFCVKNSYQWHRDNIEMNPHHYSAMRLFGANAITCWQKNIGARIYFNTLVPLSNNITIKYGVISENYLLDDLQNWSHLYLAGRLHKPIEIFHLSSEKIEKAIDQNLSHAMRVALLLLPEKFTWYQLFYTISSLSYDGDFRMIFGENKNKVRNIVQSQLMEFKQLYGDTIVKSEFSQYMNENDNSMLVQCKESKSLLNHLQKLPNEVQRRLIAVNGNGEKSIMAVHADERLEKLSQFKSNEVSLAVKKSIDSIVWRSSILQSMKNIPTAGIGKSLQYSWKKALKTFQS